MDFISFTITKSNNSILDFTHTGLVENLNAVKAKYAPKRSFFSHSSMLTKAALAAIDNNMNTERAQVIGDSLHNRL